MTDQAADGERIPVVIFLYNRMFDPVVQSNIWLFIKDMLAEERPAYRFHVVTFEDPKMPLTTKQENLVRQWTEAGLEWTALDWHRGTSLALKGLDFLAGFRTVAKLRLKGFRNLLAFCSIAGSFAYLYARLLGMRLFIHSYEPHSEIAVASGMWLADSWQYRITKRLEGASGRFAHVIGSGTRFMRDRLDALGSQASFFRIPTVVDCKKFRFSAEDREAVRKEIGVGAGQKLLFYTGKFGGLYYDVEIAEVMATLLRQEPELRLLIVTPDDDEKVAALFERAGVSPQHYSIRHSTYEDIERYYSAGDIGLLTIPPGPGQQFRSSIKTGEYLCSGMPFITATGVSEDYLHATEQDVGVVVDAYTPEAVNAAWPRIARLMGEDRETLRSRCREFGLLYRGFDTLSPRFREAMAELTRSE